MKQKNPNSSNPPPVPAADAGVMMEVEISPGKTARMKIPRSKVGVFGLIKVVVGEGGAAKLIWKTWHTRVALNKELPAQLGLSCHVDTLRCLVHSGLVRGERFSPGVTLICLDSLATHMEATSGPAAREYWDEERTRAYSTAWKELHQGLTTRGIKQPWHRQRRNTPLELPPLPLPLPLPPMPAPVITPGNQPELF